MQYITRQEFDAFKAEVDERLKRMEPIEVEGWRPIPIEDEPSPERMIQEEEDITIKITGTEDGV